MHYCYRCKKCLIEDIVYFQSDKTYCSDCCPWLAVENVENSYIHTIHTSICTKLINSLQYITSFQYSLSLLSTKSDSNINNKKQIKK